MTTARRTAVTGRPRGRPRTGVREAILAAAEELLAVDGVGQLSTKELAKHAGVAESSIFYHFGDRLGLLHAIIEAHEPLYKDVVDRLGARAGRDSLRDNLVVLMEALESFFLRITPILAAMQSDAVLRADFAARGKELNAGPHRALSLVLPYLARERDAGRIRPGADLEAAALVIVGVAQQHALDRHLTGKPAALPDFVRAAALIAPGLER